MKISNNPSSNFEFFAIENKFLYIFPAFATIIQEALIVRSSLSIITEYSLFLSLSAKIIPAIK